MLTERPIVDTIAISFTFPSEGNIHNDLNLREDLNDVPPHPLRLHLTLQSRDNPNRSIQYSTIDYSALNAYGQEVHVITDAEISSFNIADQTLKQAVQASKSRAPNDVFLRSPTPWDDIYTRYNWHQVTTTLVPISTEVLDITSEPTTVKSSYFENTSSQTGTFDVSVAESVRNTVTSTWDRSGSVSVGQTFKYDVEFLGSGGGGETSFSFEYGWGEGGSESTTVMLGSTSGVQVELEPGESVSASLTASRGTMKVKVTYRATLSGHVASNYDPTFEDHHFWAYDINDVLAAGNLPRELFVEETLDIGYYSDSSVVLSDHH